MKKIVLRHAHEEGMSGFEMEVDDDVKKVTVPMVCGCQAFFAPAGWEEGEREAWKQVGHKFKEYSA